MLVIIPADQHTCCSMAMATNTCGGVAQEQQTEGAGCTIS
jgi:hypothetical protein